MYARLITQLEEACAGILLGMPRGHTQERRSPAKVDRARGRNWLIDCFWQEGMQDQAAYSNRIACVRHAGSKNFGAADSCQLPSFLARVRLKLPTSAADAAAVGQFKY